jgi:dihydrodipicolinate synthase/N-acetylneuraminate lyase
LNFHQRFTGIFPALATPLDERGEVDVPAVRRIVSHLVQGGVSGIWALGSGGEFASLTSEQRRLLLQTAVTEAHGRVPVLAGISDTCLSRILDHARAAQEAGADAVFAVTPFYYQMTTDEATRFFLDLAERVALPLVVYHNPFNARGKLDARAVAQLADHPNIAGVKDSSCDLALFQEMLDAARGRDNFRTIQGHDPLMVPSVMLGADGAVIASALIAPKLVMALYGAVKVHDLTAVARLNRQVRRLNDVYTIDGASDASFLAGQKAALEILGLCSRRPAPPFAPLDDEQVGRIRSILREAGLIT